MRELAPVLALVALFLLALLLMWAGWRRRARRQTSRPMGKARPGTGLALPEPLWPDAAPGADPIVLDAADGVYVATTLADRPLERVTAHGLGSRARVRVRRTAGPPHGDAWELLREGAPDLAIPVADLDAVLTAPGMVGKWIGGDGLLVLRWHLGGSIVDTGLRLDERAAHERLLRLGRGDTGADGPDDNDLSTPERGTP